MDDVLINKTKLNKLLDRYDQAYGVLIRHLRDKNGKCLYCEAERGIPHTGECHAQAFQDIRWREFAANDPYYL